MRRFPIALAGFSLAALAAPRPAAAEGGHSIFEPLTMDHFTPVSTLHVDLSYVKYDEPDNIDTTVLGITIGGQYVTPSGVGGYLSIPLSYLAYQVDLPAPLGGDDSDFALGNVEVGGIYSKRLDRRASIVLHGGIALPTASDNDLAVGQILASSPRYGSLVQRIPDSTWIRFGVSPMGRTGKLFWRADLGLDLALDEDNTPTYSPVFRVSVGGGVDLGQAHVLAELVNVVTDDGSDDETTSTFSLGVRFISGKLRPGLALILPIGFDRDAFGPDFALAFSLAARL